MGLALGQLGTGLGGFGGSTGGPSGADSTTGTAVIDKHFPNANQSPAAVLFKFPAPVWTNLSALSTAEQGLGNISAFRAVLGPLDPTGIPVSVAQLTRLHALLGNPQALPEVPPANSPVPLAVYNGYRAIGQYLSPDGETVQFVASLKDTSSSPAAVNAIPSLRTAVAHVAAAPRRYPDRHRQHQRVRLRRHRDL